MSRINQINTANPIYNTHRHNKTINIKNTLSEIDAFLFSQSYTATATAYTASSQGQTKLAINEICYVQTIIESWLLWSIRAIKVILP